MMFPCTQEHNKSKILYLYFFIIIEFHTTYILIIIFPMVMIWLISVPLFSVPNKDCFDLFSSTIDLILYLLLFSLIYTTQYPFTDFYDLILFQRLNSDINVVHVYYRRFLRHVENELLTNKGYF
jgi:hypothetical protein